MDSPNSSDEYTPERAQIEGASWEFFADDGGLWFGPRPAQSRTVNLMIQRPELDSLQILFAVACLQRCGRNTEAARVFSAQTECTLEQAEEFCANGDVAPDATFAAPPWPVATLAETTSAIKRRRRGNIVALAAFGAGALVALAFMLVVLLW